MKLVGKLLTEAEDLVTLGEQIAQTRVERGWGCPERRLQEGGESGEELRVEGIGLGALKGGLSKVMGLTGIDEADGKARLLETLDDVHPVTAGGFDHDQNGVVRLTEGVEGGKQGAPTGGGLLEGPSGADGVPGWPPGGAQAGGSNVDADKGGIGGYDESSSALGIGYNAKRRATLAS